MLSDEEKKAIEIIKGLAVYYEDYGLLDEEEIEENEEVNNSINIILNLIEKQSKEIEELKEDKYGLEEEVQIQAKNLMLCENALSEIQDKIKTKIEELKQKKYILSSRESEIEILQSLLEKE